MSDGTITELDSRVERLEDHILTFEEIEKADDLPRDTVVIPEWGGSVQVRGLSRGEVEQANEDATNRKTGMIDNVELNKLLLCWGSVAPKITGKNYPTLKKKNAGAVKRILQKILDLSGLGEEAQQQAKDAFRE